MYIVAKLIKRHNKLYTPSNGKDRGKGAPQILEKVEEDGVDFKTLQVLQSEEEALIEAERRIEENPHHHYIVFAELTELLTDKPSIKYIDKRVK